MGATSYNRAIHSWDVSNVLSFRSMFENTSYNRNISPWNMTSAVDLDRMFYKASDFSQGLCRWGNLIPMEASTTDMFIGTACPVTSSPVLTTRHFPLCVPNCTSNQKKKVPSLIKTITGTIAKGTSSLESNSGGSSGSLSGAIVAVVVGIVLLIALFVLRRNRVLRRKMRSSTNSSGVRAMTLDDEVSVSSVTDGADDKLLPDIA